MTATGWSTRVKLVVFGSAALVVLGSCLPWATVSAGFVSATKNGIEGDGVITLIIAIVVAGLFALIKARRTAAILTIIGGALTAAIAVYDIVDVSGKSTTSGQVTLTTSVEIGLILVAVAAAGIVVGGVMALAESRNESVGGSS